MISVTLYALSALGGRHSNRTFAGGAGIFGLAIGFGAQTLVRNVISGVFRIGECIESGTSTKATAEHPSVWTAAKKPSEEDRALADEAKPKNARLIIISSLRPRRPTIGPAVSRFLPYRADLSRTLIYLVNSVSRRSRKKEDSAVYCL
jgi:hypothetical protein